LESLAQEYAGRFVLAKADTEQTSAAAGKFSVSSIPAVYGVVAGEIVDGFVGALPERQLRGWLDRLLESAGLAKLVKMAETDPASAEGPLRERIEKAPNDAALRIALAKALFALERFDESSAVIEELEKRGFLEPDAERIKASLELRSMKSDSPDELRASAEAHPDDLSAQLKFAEALAANQQYDEALPRLLAIIERDKRGPGDTARQVMLDIFRVLPNDSPLVSTYRRKLATALY
jgi:putative thioredoxin